MEKIKPDLGYIDDIIANGGDNLKKCFQCATCTSVCSLSEGDNPFPRKQMALMQWGLKDQVVRDKNLWLCHQCGDCTSNCPRGVKPADVIASARRTAISHYSLPVGFSKYFADQKFLPALLIGPAIILLIFLGMIGHLNIPSGDVHFAAFLPHAWLNTFFTGLLIVMGYFLVKSVLAFWKDINEKQDVNSKLKDNFVPAGIETVKEILTHVKFNKCEANKFRQLGHLGIFYGFMALLFVTGIVVILAILEMYPLNFFNPLKILGNMSAIALLAGLYIVWNNRTELQVDNLKSTYFDWYFFWILGAVAVTGILTELLRFANIAILAYPIYFVHLVVVFNLLIFMPYSKFAHVIYRSVAIFHDKLASIK
jgi:quinone-modifying oxidoreductase, subunit QmoC